MDKTVFDLKNSVSESIVPKIGSCGISNALTNPAFDHKEIVINFKKNCPYPKNKQVQNNSIKDKFVKITVKLAAYECYLHHLVPDPNITQEFVNDNLIHIGRALALINQLNETRLEFSRAEDDMLRARSNDLETELDEIVDNLPGIRILEEGVLSCSPEFFFEALCCVTREAAVKQQDFIYKLKTETEKNLNAELFVLKQDPINNQNIINRKERELTEFLGRTLKEELRNFDKFEFLNNEKITPYFLGLIKNNAKEASLGDITEENGRTFAESDERDEYIRKTFADLYKKPDENILSPDCITEFLDDVADNETVRNAKLNNVEKANLDRNLTIEELDQSIKQAKTKSAPGADGFSNRFIQEFWDIYRVPLFKMIGQCYANNKLTDQFKTANIKLIPKKGNLKLLKNWRPISLLSCFYKTISRAIGTRLKSVMDKLTPTAQKGYSCTKRCQEVLIEIIEGINNCKIKQKKGALLSLDIRKAFDCIGHEYLDRVLSFFNFGPNFKKWLKLLSTDRMATIILENNKATKVFKLHRGNAQGDILSPFLFLLGYQILLFKLQFDLQIEGIIDSPAADPARPCNLPPEVSTRYPKVAAMADDATIIIKLCPRTLNKVKEVLEKFGTLSGLCCNIEKTVLVPIGKIEAIDQDIVDLGFEIKGKALILGLEVSNDDSITDTAVSKIIEKINLEINRWARFNLSLPGRINIAKSMLYSQVNYLGSILNLSDTHTDRLSRPIEQFVSGNLRLAKSRIFTSKENGGLGLTDLRIFLASQKCGWIKLALKLDENWKQLLYLKSGGDIGNLREKWVQNNPILKGFGKALDFLRRTYSMECENFRKANIFDTPIFPLTRRPLRTIDENFLEEPQQFDAVSKLTRLTFDHFWNGEGGRELQEITQTTGIQFTQDQAEKIIGMCRDAVTRYSKDCPTEQSSFALLDFITRYKKGSKIFRNILTKEKAIFIPHNIKKYSTNTDCVINLNQSRTLGKLWAATFFDNVLKTFIFKLHNNTLGYNYTVSKFVRNHPDTCTFCDIRETVDEVRETPIHLFFQCASAEPIVENIFRWALGDEYDRMTMRDYFGGFEGENANRNNCLNILGVTVKKYLWDCKNIKKLPEIEECKICITKYVKNWYNSSSKFRLMWERAGIRIRF